MVFLAGLRVDAHPCVDGVAGRVDEGGDGQTGGAELALLLGLRDGVALDEDMAQRGHVIVGAIGTGAHGIDADEQTVTRREDAGDATARGGTLQPSIAAESVDAAVLGDGARGLGVERAGGDGKDVGRFETGAKESAELGGVACGMTNVQ